MCRGRFRAKVVDGLRESEGRWSRASGYGNFWHKCEEALAKGPAGWSVKTGELAWEMDLRGYAQSEVAKHRADQEEINHWYNVCRVQFPLYAAHWAEHPDTTARTPLFQEQCFDVPYGLPSGRVVRLRGRWDSVDIEGKGKTAGVVLMENKTKGDVDEPRMVRQLTNDLQSMLYLVAFQVWQGLDDHGTPVRTPQAVRLPIRAVRYNVVRRPLSGGAGTIKRREGSAGAKCPKCKGAGTAGCPKCGGRGRVGGTPPETPVEFYDRLRGVIAADPGHFFMRWRVEVNAADITRFRRETLDPVLEQLCDWWSWIKADLSAAVTDPFSPCDGTEADDNTSVRSAVHYVTPYGCGIIDEYPTPYDEYIRTGSELGLCRTDDLFPELSRDP